MIQRDDDEGVADFFVGNKFRDFRDGHEASDQIFAAVEFHAVLQAADLIPASWNIASMKRTRLPPVFHLK